MVVCIQHGSKSERARFGCKGLIAERDHHSPLFTSNNIKIARALPLVSVCAGKITF